MPTHSTLHPILLKPTTNSNPKLSTLLTENTRTHTRVEQPSPPQIGAVTAQPLPHSLSLFLSLSRDLFQERQFPRTVHRSRTRGKIRSSSGFSFYVMRLVAVLYYPWGGCWFSTSVKVKKKRKKTWGVLSWGLLCLVLLEELCWWWWWWLWWLFLMVSFVLGEGFCCNQKRG